MWIKREISAVLENDTHNLVQILLGPRQSGKTSLLWKIGDKYTLVSFDDLQTRELAQKDPALFLSQQTLPLIIDEAQYAPNIFSEIKKVVDELKRDKLRGKELPKGPLFRLTGSNQVLMDKNVKESLVGRASYYSLNTLSVFEIIQAFPNTSIMKIIYQGGWPELYTSEQSPKKYLNDYIRSFIEKDIVLGAGIQKQSEFHTVLGMLAARTGELLDYSSIAKNSGVRSVTIKEWVSILERSNILYILRPYHSNLNKRLTKTPKIYFLDTGLACRLQGHQEQKPMEQSPQAGHLFETLVLGELARFINNHSLDWKIYLWRTKDNEEVDFIVETSKDNVIALEVKMGIHSVHPISIPKRLKIDFPHLKTIHIVSIGGKKQKLNNECEQIPLVELRNFLFQQT